ncbi:hypothetical protein Vau01_093700 [Virgisporangium aurantiacum]|uniref:Uncharacterized protein n=1 Tax=Virgisporangium aurantiacum TaxID=175570 RepID=A0A8J4E581_9ACTN|nr:hypothetical protein Vau01_093700 [Virgisporangium aurantiacum]
MRKVKMGLIVSATAVLAVVGALFLLDKHALSREGESACSLLGSTYGDGREDPSRRVALANELNRYASRAGEDDIRETGSDMVMWARSGDDEDWTFGYGVMSEVCSQAGWVPDYEAPWYRLSDWF